MMDEKEAVELLRYLKRDVLANSPYDLALDAGIDALEKMRAFGSDVIRDAPAAADHIADTGKKVGGDAVDHPQHYTRGDIECIDAIEAATAGMTGIEAFCAGNALKYIWRFKYKNGAEDIGKAIWYLQRAQSILKADTAEGLSDK